MKKNHGLIIFLMVIISLLAVGAVSASENMTDVVETADFDDVVAIEESVAVENATGNIVSVENNAETGEILSVGSENEPVAVNVNNEVVIGDSSSNNRFDWSTLYKNKSNNTLVYDFSNYFGKDKGSSFLVLDLNNIAGDKNKDHSYVVLGLSDVLGLNNTNDKSYFVFGLSSILDDNNTDDDSYLVIDVPGMSKDGNSDASLVLDLTNLLSGNATSKGSFLFLNGNGTSSSNISLEGIVKNNALLGLNLTDLVPNVTAVWDNITSAVSGWNLTDLVPKFDFNATSVWDNITSIIGGWNLTDLVPKFGFNATSVWDNITSAINAWNLTGLFNVSDIGSFNLSSLVDGLNLTGLFDDLENATLWNNLTIVDLIDGMKNIGLFDNLTVGDLFNSLKNNGLLDYLNSTEFFDGLSIAEVLESWNASGLLKNLNVSVLWDNLKSTGIFNNLTVGDLLDNLTGLYNGLNITELVDGLNITKLINITDFINNITKFISDLNISGLNISDIEKAISDAGKAVLGIKSPTVIYADDVSVVYGNTKKIVITLRDYVANPISGKKVYIVYNDTDYTGVTDSEGKFSITVPNNLKPKTYPITVTFAGDRLYENAIKDAKLTVTKATPKITAKTKTFKRTVKTKKYTITLKNHKSKIMKYTKVTIKVKGKTYYAKTNSKGKATFKITKLTKKGTFKAVVTFKGNAYYKKVTKNVNIKVK